MDRRYAVRVTAIYVLVAGMWILLSDGALSVLGLTSAQIAEYSIFKGLAFVLVTALVLHSAIDRSTRRISSANERLATFIDVAPIPIVSLDLESKVVLWNPAAERVFGWSAQEVLGKKNPLVREEDWDGFLEYQARLRVAPNTAGIEITRRRKDGTLLALRNFNAAIRDESGRIVGTIGVLENITEQNAAAIELERYRDHLAELVEERTIDLRRANDALQRATEAKDTFLASMSHELRTPLNSIIGFTQILLKGLAGPLNEEQAKQLGMVNVSGRHLLSLIDDVLDLAKVEAGRTSIHLERIRISEVVDSVEGTIGPLLRSKGLEWTREGDVDETLVTDRRRLEQILLNLLSNAVKFTEEGTVRLTVRRADALVRFEVADTGVGMSPDSLRTVFGEFVQIETKDAIRPSGTGLGLAISLRLARLLGGSLVAASQEGVGSTFVLTLPVGVMQSGGRPTDGTVCDVLVVGDDPRACALIGASLEHGGYAVRTASDDARALDLIRMHLPHAIVLDTGISRIAGTSLLEQLKVGSETADIPIIRMSIMVESEQAAVEGFSGYVIEPIDPAGLLDKLDTVLVGRCSTGDVREGSM